MLALVVCMSLGMVTGRDAIAQRASESAVDVGLTYQAPAGCPSSEVVVQQLAARGLRVIDGGGARRRLTIAVAPGAADAPRFRGKLSVEGASPGKQAPSQTVSGRDCQAVTLSLTLVAALALIPVSDAAAEGPPAGAITVSPGEADADRGRPTWFVGALGRGMTGLGERPALGFGAFVERVWGQKPDAIAMTSLIVSVETAAPPTITLPQGSADLRVYLGRLEGCWFGGIIAARAVFLSPCAGMEGGLLHGSGGVGQDQGSINQPQTATRPWLAPVVSVRGAVRLTRGVWFSFGGAAFAPLVRDTFVFNDPRATIHRSPAVGGLLELGLAGALW
ncbi:MAG TPA: hypothetical protein VNO55_05635 [Polyangia bacterium]|nr:hypothetical protein [Polyangia bacterium]